MDPGGGIGGRVEVRLLFVLSRVLFFCRNLDPSCLGASVSFLREDMDERGECVEGLRGS